MWLLLPAHYIMGPIHGAIVNRFGHKYGYVNYDDTGDLFQNNHHRFPSSPNCAKKSFEFDPAYPILKILEWVGIIRFSKS